MAEQEPSELDGLMAELSANLDALNEATRAALRNMGMTDAEIDAAIARAIKRNP